MSRWGSTISTCRRPRGRKILVTNTPDVLTDTTADFAFALLHGRGAARGGGAQVSCSPGKWTKWRIDLLVGQDIHHRTLGIFGMGRIGQAVARRGARVLHADSVSRRGARAGSGRARAGRWSS